MSPSPFWFGVVVVFLAPCLRVLTVDFPSALVSQVLLVYRRVLLVVGGRHWSSHRVRPVVCEIVVLTLGVVVLLTSPIVRPCCL